MNTEKTGQDLYNSDRNFIKSKYLPTTSSASQSCSFKHLQRKPNPGYRNEMLSRERKRRENQLADSDPQICYISTSKEKKGLDRVLSGRGRQGMASHRNYVKDDTKIKEVNIKNNQGDKISKDSENKGHKSPVILQIEQLRLSKISLNRELRTLKHEIESKDQKILNLDKKVKELTEKMSKPCSKCMDYSLKFTELASQIQQQRLIIQTYELTMKSRQEEKNNSIETREDLQKIITDIHRNFEELSFNESILSNQDQSMVSTEQRLQLVIANMREKIKYLQIEIAMMKKDKYDFHNIEMECEKYKIQNKVLFSKIKNMSDRQYRKQFDIEEEISFELSTSNIIPH